MLIIFFWIKLPLKLPKFLTARWYTEAIGTNSAKPWITRKENACTERNKGGKNKNQRVKLSPYPPYCQQNSSSTLASNSGWSFPSPSVPILANASSVTTPC